MLNSDQIEELHSKISDDILKKLCMANSKNSLSELLNKLGYKNFIDDSKEYDPYLSLRNARILIVGNSQLALKDFESIFTRLRMPKGCFERLDFDEFKHYNFKKLQYQDKFSDILFGPVPHSNTSKGDYSSVIKMMEKEKGYPKIIRLNANDSLKISKSSLEDGIMKTRKYFYINTIE